MNIPQERKIMEHIAINILGISGAHRKNRNSWFRKP
jgi:hypothetical protein